MLIPRSLSSASDLAAAIHALVVDRRGRSAGSRLERGGRDGDAASNTAATRTSGSSAAPPAGALVRARGLAPRARRDAGRRARRAGLGWHGPARRARSSSRSRVERSPARAASAARPGDTTPASTERRARRRADRAPLSAAPNHPSMPTRCAARRSSPGAVSGALRRTRRTRSPSRSAAAARLDQRTLPSSLAMHARARTCRGGHVPPDGSDARARASVRRAEERARGVGRRRVDRRQLGRRASSRAARAAMAGRAGRSTDAASRIGPEHHGHARAKSSDPNLLEHRRRDDAFAAGRAERPVRGRRRTPPHSAPPAARGPSGIPSRARACDDPEHVGRRLEAGDEKGGRSRARRVTSLVLHAALTSGVARAEALAGYKRIAPPRCATYGTSVAAERGGPRRSYARSLPPDVAARLAARPAGTVGVTRVRPPPRAAVTARAEHASTRADPARARPSGRLVRRRRAVRRRGGGRRARRRDRRARRELDDPALFRRRAVLAMARRAVRGRFLRLRPPRDRARRSRASAASVVVCPFPAERLSLHGAAAASSRPRCAPTTAGSGWTQPPRGRSRPADDAALDLARARTRRRRAAARTRGRRRGGVTFDGAATTREGAPSPRSRSTAPGTPSQTSSHPDVTSRIFPKASAAAARVTAASKPPAPVDVRACIRQPGLAAGDVAALARTFDPRPNPLAYRLGPRDLARALCFLAPADLAASAASCARWREHAEGEPVWRDACARVGRVEDDGVERRVRKLARRVPRRRRDPRERGWRKRPWRGRGGPRGLRRHAQGGDSRRRRRRQELLPAPLRRRLFSRRRSSRRSTGRLQARRPSRTAASVSSCSSGTRPVRTPESIVV